MFGPKQRTRRHSGTRAARLFTIDAVSFLCFRTEFLLAARPDVNVTTFQALAFSPDFFF